MSVSPLSTRYRYKINKNDLLRISVLNQVELTVPADCWTRFIEPHLRVNSYWYGEGNTHHRTRLTLYYRRSRLWLGLVHSTVLHDQWFNGKPAQVGSAYMSELESTKDNCLIVFGYPPDDTIHIASWDLCLIRHYTVITLHWVLLLLLCGHYYMWWWDVIITIVLVLCS